MTPPNESLQARMYNGLDKRRSYPVINPSPKFAKTPTKSWWKRLLGL